MEKKNNDNLDNQFGFMLESLTIVDHDNYLNINYSQHSWSITAYQVGAQRLKHPPCLWTIWIDPLSIHQIKIPSS